MRNRFHTLQIKRNTYSGLERKEIQLDMPLCEESCVRLLNGYAAQPSEAAYNKVITALDRYQRAYKRMIDAGMVLGKEYPNDAPLSLFLANPTEERRKALEETFGLRLQAAES